MAAAVLYLLLTLSFVNFMGSFYCYGTSLTFDIIHVETPCVRTAKHTLARPKQNVTLALMTILLFGDIQLNYGPPNNKSVFPCGMCDIPLTIN